MLGYTSGGSPIFYSQKKTRGLSKPKGKTRYTCSVDERHKLSPNQAKSSGYLCSHCGADLKVRKQKVLELHQLAKSLGYDLEENNK